MQPPPFPRQFEKRDERERGPRYKILRQLASGGMGHVYLARARGIEGFERLVVLKRLKPDVAARQENVESFLDEVRVLASMQHDNVVHIYDVGVAKDGSYFYSMEFLVGQDLRRLILRGLRQGQAVPMPQALFIASSVLAGLHHVHQRLGPTGEALQIVHRDVSPANIFITYEGGVKLIDFGIAKTARQSSDAEQGVIKGKIRYMSPEQCRLEPMDARSDVFSLGIVLWEMTTGQGLFKNYNDYEALATIAGKDAPRPSVAVADYPKDLEAVIMKALARRVNARWQSAREMQLALEEVAAQRRWPQSSGGMSELMEAHFAPEIAALRGSRAAGQDLADFVVLELADVLPTPSAVSARRVAPSHLASEPEPVDPLPGSAIVPVGRGTPPRSSQHVRTSTQRSLGPVALGGLLSICIGVGIGFVVGQRSHPPPVTHLVVDALSVPTDLELAEPAAAADTMVGSTKEASTAPRVEQEEPLELAPLPVLPTTRPRRLGERSGDGAAKVPDGQPARPGAPVRRVVAAAAWHSDSPFPPP